MVDLTVVILTKDEEKNIEKCIKSFRSIAKRFVVVDSYSSDRTIELSKKLGAEVYQNIFVDHATQMNWGLKNTNINTEWIMRIDSDEELTKELSIEIENKLNSISNKVNGIKIKRRVYFMSKWIKYGGVYPTILLRIFRNGTAFCEQKIMDEHMVLKEGNSITFNKDLIDNNTKSLSWWINKHNWYSDNEIADYDKIITELTKDDKLKPNLFGNQAERKRWFKYYVFYRTPLMKRAYLYFIYRYFIKLGFLDGKEGLIFHFLQGYWYRFLVDAKIYERNKKGKIYRIKKFGSIK